MSKTYRAASYLRLSQEDGKEGESGSIETQRGMIREFAVNNDDIELVGEYADDGWSGYEFDRPGFTQMVEDIKAKKIDCVIVKDFSRFGRNFQKTEEYIHKRFPKLGVRFISILNGYDSAKELSAGERLSAPIVNLLNEWHVMETSRKIRNAFEFHMRNGDIINGSTPYGYVLRDKQYTIDPEAARIVRRIFYMKIEGWGTQAIADELNRNETPCPLEHSIQNGGRRSGAHWKKYREAQWFAPAVLRILRNPVYIGCLIQGKTTTPSYKDPTVLIKDPKDWYVFENAHEPIVSQTTFQIVTDLIGRDNYAKTGKRSYLFTGFAFCGNCGGQLFHRVSGKTTYWQCMNKECGDKQTIKEQPLINAVYETLKAHLTLVLDYSRPANPSEWIKSMEENDEDIKHIEARIKVFHNALDTFTGKEAPDATDLDLTVMPGHFSAEIARLRSEKEKVIEVKTKLAGAIASIQESFHKYAGMNELTREMVVTFTERITVEPGKTIRIRFRYADFFTSDAGGGESNVT